MSDFEIHNPKELLTSLRWRSDMIITDHFGERVWLTNCPGGITDCCLASDPCDYHARITHQGTGERQ